MRQRVKGSCVIWRSKSADFDVARKYFELSASRSLVSVTPLDTTVDVELIIKLETPKRF